jgi:signal transduction histidine kinase
MVIEQSATAQGVGQSPLPVLLAYWDASLHCRFANLGYLYWFGKSPESMLGVHLQDLLGARLFELNRIFIEGALAGIEQHFDRTLTSADGVVCPCSVRYLPDRVDGVVRGFIVEIYAMPGAANNGLGSVLGDAATVDSGAWQWEISADITVWSPEICALFAYPSTQLPPRFEQQRQFYTRRSWTLLHAAVTLAVKEGCPFALPLEIARGNGKTGWVLMHGIAEHDDAGCVAMLRGTMTPVPFYDLPVTDLARIPAGDNSGKLDAVEHAHRMIALGHLTAGAVHDLNNCLALIANAAMLLDHHIADPTLKPLVERCARGAERCGSMTRRLLDMARTDSGVHAPVEVQDMIAGCLDLLTIAVGPAIELRCHFSVSCWIKVDVSMFEIALLNLAMNARDAMPAGGQLTISVQYGNTAHLSDAKLEIAITDTGSGMSADVLACATTAFFTTKPPGEGTGLGLEMVNDFARRSGGLLHLRSTVGVGTTATICLPSRASPT